MEQVGMAHSLRYYKELEHPDGKVIRLEFHKQDNTEGTQEFGAIIQGLSLQLQGQQGDIDTPIVKTSLAMSFCDCGDIDNGFKTGDWEEFYLATSTEWMVVVLVGTSDTPERRAIWGGYLTPDSFSEDLSYRGTINLTARDNVGHLQDFSFDMKGDIDGMAYMYQLIEAGWAKIKSPMQLYFYGDEMEADYLQTNGVDADSTLLNVAQFEGKNWYEVIESILYSYGLVLRYWGDNFFRVCSLRDLPKQNRVSVDELPHIIPVFVKGATRELMPAAKMIEETANYEIENESALPKISKDDFTGAAVTYQCAVEGVEVDGTTAYTPEHTAPVYPIKPSTRYWDNIESSTLFFDPTRYGVGWFETRQGRADEILNGFYIAANNVDNRYVWFSKKMQCTDFDINMKFGQPIHIGVYASGASNDELEFDTNVGLSRIVYVIQMEQNGVTQYYTGYSWRTQYKELVKEYDPLQEATDFNVFVRMDGNTGTAELRLYIIKIEYKTISRGEAGIGLYANILNFSFAVPDNIPMLENNTIKTIYNEDNNVTIVRNPKIAPAMNAVATPSVIKNGIFYKSGGVVYPATEWNWRGGEPTQMGVLIHKQLLCYYAKSNNLITGTIVNADLNNMRTIYMWGDKEHILISGTYNLLNGHIEGAVLREFLRYEDMWGNEETAQATRLATGENGKETAYTTTDSGKRYTKSVIYR